MNISKPFILRPVATSLLMAGVLLAGAVAYRQLPVSALPQVDYPTIQVVTFYPGASPEVMSSSVTAPLERQFGQVPGLKQMTSTSSFGCSVITLQFSLDLSIDIAEQEVQAAINAGRSEEHTSELQSLRHLVCRLLLEKKKATTREEDKGARCTGPTTCCKFDHAPCPRETRRHGDPGFDLRDTKHRTRHRS